MRRKEFAKVGATETVVAIDLVMLVLMLSSVGF